MLKITASCASHCYHCFSNCPPLPYKFWQLALHKNLSGSHMIKIKRSHWVKLVRVKSKDTDSLKLFATDGKWEHDLGLLSTVHIINIISSFTCICILKYFGLDCIQDIACLPFYLVPSRPEIPLLLPASHNTPWSLSGLFLVCHPMLCNK